MQNTKFNQDNILKFPTKFKNPYNKNSLNSIVLHFNDNNSNKDKYALLPGIINLLDITGQRPGIIKSNKSISAFKIRKGMEIGGILTLRKQNLKNFINLLILNWPVFNTTIKLNKFNNVTFGIVNNTKLFSTSIPICGLNIILQFKGNNKESNSLLLSSMGFPIINK